jgi:ferredoxin
MADRFDKHLGQPDGPLYVDTQCIDCDLCRQTAPENFTRDEEGGYSYIHRQPTTAAELELCLEAMESCPVEAIGNDGAGDPVTTIEELSAQGRS